MSAVGDSEGIGVRYRANGSDETGVRFCPERLRTVFAANAQNRAHAVVNERTSEIEHIF